MKRAAIESFLAVLVSLAAGSGVAAAGGVSSTGRAIGFGDGGRTAAACGADDRTFAPSGPKYQHFWRVERSTR
jgi:hypothetical protein